MNNFTIKNTANEKKQTAVEWLALYIKGITTLNCDEVIDQAKAMEKEQIIEAYLDGANACDLEVKGDIVLLVKPDTNLSGQEYFYQIY